MKGLKICAGLLFIAVLTGIGYSQVQWVWRVLPYSEFGISDSPPPYGLVQNNGWAVAKAYPRSGFYDSIDTIHVVFTDNGDLRGDRRPRVYWRLTTNGGRSWSNAYCLSAELHRPSGYGESAYDATIGCLGDTVAVAFYDQWLYHNDSAYPHQIVYTHRYPGMQDWKPLEPLIKHLFIPPDSQWAKHPSLVLQRRTSDTWRLGANVLYSYTRIHQDMNWIDAPTENLLEILPRYNYNGEHRMGAQRDSSDYLTVAWNGTSENDTALFWYAFQKLKSDGTWRIHCGRKVYSAGIEETRLTDTLYFPSQGQYPCIQALLPRSQPDVADTAIVAYLSPGPGGRIYVAIVAHNPYPQHHLEVVSNQSLFPEHPGVYWPNLWRKNDTVYMVFIGRLMQAYFSFSTDRGRSWQTPIPVSGYWSLTPSVTTTDFGRAYFVYAALSPEKIQHLHFREIRAVASPVAWPPVKVDGISPNTARVLQQMQVPGSYLVRAYPVEDFVAVDRSTDDGLSWKDMFSPGWGRNPSIATDRDSVVAAFFVEDSLLYCAWWYPQVGDWTEPKVVFAGVSGVKPLNPSVALYPGNVGGMKVAGVVFAVYDTVEGKSRVMFAKVDTGTVIIDTIEARNDLSDSFPCINIVNTDSVYVTYQRGSAVVSSALYNYSAGSTTRPPDWAALGSITGDGFHPMAALENGILHCVWTRRIHTQNGSDTSIICHSTLDVTGTSQFSGWQEAPELSCRTTAEKDNPVYAGVGVVVWQEKVNGRWRIRARVRGDTMTMVAGEHDCQYPQAVAESSAVSPSIDQVRVKLLWIEKLAGDTAVLGFKVESLNVSRANANATRYNNGQKLVQKAGSDSLFAVYTDLDGAVMFARSATGDSWKRQVLTQDCEYPAIAYDGTGRLWAVMNYTGSGHTKGVEVRYRRADGTWSTPKTIYPVSAGSVGPATVATSSDQLNSCAYAAFPYDNGTNRLLIIAKFDTGRVRLDTVVIGADIGAPGLATETDAGGQGDYLHLVWSAQGEVNYTMSETPIPADNWQPGFPASWRSVVNLSNSPAPSLHPVIGADQDRIVVAWAEGETPDIYARYRSPQSEYNSWDEVVNLSNTAQQTSDYPEIGLGDTCLVVWQENVSETDYDILACVEFTDTFTVQNTAGKSTYPQVLFQKKVSGDTAIPILHCIWSEAAGENYYEVRYQRLNLNRTGGGGQQGAEFTYLEPQLYQSVPNPFSTRTQIRYQICQEGNVRLKVYDTQGRLVRSLVSGKQRPGSYTVVWDGRDEQGRIMANGVYFYRLDVPNFTATKKALLLR